MAQTYPVILADPPWAFSAWAFSAWNEAKVLKHVSHKYATMNPQQIAALPIRDLAHRDAALFLWVTFPNLEAGFAVLRAWGFEYRTCAFTWVKTTRAGTPATGLGFYTRSNAELCLLGVRGRMVRKAKDIGQVIMAPRREHSRKPDEQYLRIMRLFDGPYLELFARQQWPGWDVWGNQAGKFPAQPFLFAV